MKFMCKHSGCVYVFESEHEIRSLLTHPDYVKYEEPEVKEEPKQEAPKRGRPAKKSEEPIE
jgi:hypothetical protein